MDALPGKNPKHKPFTFSRLSLRHVLPVLFFFLASVPAVTIGVVLTNKAWDRELQTVREQHLQLARNLAGALERYAEDVDAVFQMIVMAKATVVQDLPPRKLASLLGRLHFKYVVIIDRTGSVERVIYPPDAPEIEQVPRARLERIGIPESHADHPPEFSDVLSDHRGEPTIFLWQQLDENRYGLAGLKTDYFIKLQSAIRFGKDGHAVIVDRRGQIVAHPHPPWRADIKDISLVEPVRRMIAGETGVGSFFSGYLQADVIAGFTTTPKTGWGVMIPQPLSELQAHVSEVKRTVWIVVGLVLLCSAILGAAASRCLANPLQRIGQVAARFATGSYDARVGPLGAWHTREAASLAAQFNSMADDINHSWQAQRESEQRCREFGEIAADWFWETDLQQAFTYIATPSETQSHHQYPQVCVDHHRREHVANDPDGAIVARIQQYIDRGEPFDNIEYQVLGLSGERVHMSVAGRPIHNRDGEMVGYRGVARDITELLHTQAQLYQAQKAETMQHAQKMEAIGTLASGIAHDFNNILTAILGFTDLTLRQSQLDDEGRENLQQVFAAGKRAKELVQQILTFSRNSEPERKPVHLHLVIQEALTLLRASLPANIAIHQDIATDVGTVFADLTQIHQVVINLGTNADYAMRDRDGVLDIRLQTTEVDQAFATRYPTLRPGPHAHLAIRDTGDGIAPGVIDRIFDPFFTTKGVGEGTGMGLAVVHGIISNHNGIITIQSTLGSGTVFDIYLPVHNVAAAGDIGAQEEPPLRGSGSILFVDDEEALALFGQRALTHLGYDVVVSTQSTEALNIFRSAPYRFQLVISDQTMPQMTGETLARELRRIRPDIPIILCTGFSHSINAEKAKAQGIDNLLMKPLIAGDLSSAVQRLLARRTD